MTSPRRKKRERKVSLIKQFLRFQQHIQNRIWNIAKRKKAEANEIDPTQAVIRCMTNWQRHQWHKWRAKNVTQHMRSDEIVSNMERFAAMPHPEKAGLRVAASR